MPSHTVLVTAASGNIGTRLVPQLLSDNIKVVLPTSNAQNLRGSLPSNATPELAVIEEGSIKDPNWFEEIIRKHKVDVVFLCLTGSDELMVALNSFDAMQRAGTVKHLVYLSACGDYVSEKGANLVYERFASMHVVIKPLIERKLHLTKYSWQTTVLGPTMFWSNDLRSKQSMLEEGVFDEPFGEVGLSRVSTDDIALAAHNAILNPAKWGGKKINLGSKRQFKGSEIAKLWGDAIGKEVRMVKGDAAGLREVEDGFAKKIGRGSNPPPEGRAWGRDIVLMYEAFSQVGFGMSDEDYALQLELLGRKESDYEAWVKATGKSWVSG